MAITNRARVIVAKYRLQGLNALLRLLPMGLKLLLTVYMGRYFALSDIGSYGLVLGAVTILGIILGQNFGYVVIRDIVGIPQDIALHKMRDEVVLYGLNYIALSVAIFVLIATGLSGIMPKILIYTLMLTVLENLGTIGYYNMNSLQQQIPANAIFFVRSGLWVVPVILLCMFNPQLRTVDTVLIGWMGGAFASLFFTAWCWRHMPWRKVMRWQIDWEWIKKGVSKSSLVWLGMIGLTGGTFVDRFVVDHYLTTNFVGILTFYFAFTNAILTLMQSGVAAFATPRLIQHHRKGETALFHRESRQAVWQITLSAGLISVVFAIAVPLLGAHLGRPAFAEYAWTFWLLLLGTWLRSIAEMLYNILFARHQDRAIWLGNMLFLIPALGGNLLLVPLFGFIGIGYSCVVAGVFLLVWRGWFVLRPQANYI